MLRVCNNLLVIFHFCSVKFNTSRITGMVVNRFSKFLIRQRWLLKMFRKGGDYSRQGETMIYRMEISVCFR